MSFAVWFVAHDLSPQGDAALDFTMRRLARKGDRVVVAHAVNLPDGAGADHLIAAPDSGGRWDGLLEETRGRLNSICETARATKGGIEVEGMLLRGGVIDSLLTAAEQRAASTIVAGTHGHRGLTRWLLGSVSERLVRDADRPVLLVRPSAEPADSDDTLHVMMCASLSDDEIDDDGAAIDEAATLASRWGATLEVVNALEPDYASLSLHGDDHMARALRAARDGLRDRRLQLVDELRARIELPVKSSGRLLPAPHGVAEAVAEAAAESHIDLLVLCAHRKRGFDRLFGSVARRIGRQAPCSVLFVRPRPHSVVERPGTLRQAGAA